MIHSLGKEIETVGNDAADPHFSCNSLSTMVIDQVDSEMIESTKISFHISRGQPMDWLT
jgi:hypothetical protein